MLASRRESSPKLLVPGAHSHFVLVPHCDDASGLPFKDSFQRPQTPSLSHQKPGVLCIRHHPCSRSYTTPQPLAAKPPHFRLATHTFSAVGHTVGAPCRGALSPQGEPCATRSRQGRARICEAACTQGRDMSRNPFRQKGPTVGSACRAGLSPQGEPCATRSRQGRARICKAACTQGRDMSRNPFRQKGPTEIADCTLGDFRLRR